MSISALRQNFLNQHSSLPSQRTTMSSKEALAEYQVELDRVDSIRSFDGKPGDLDPKENFIKFEHPGHSLSVPSKTWGCAFEQHFSNREKPVLEYAKSEALFLAPPQAGPAVNDAGQPIAEPLPTFETWVTGTNNRNTNTWFTRRLIESPTSIRYEELNINYADPAASTKEVWLFNS